MAHLNGYRTTVTVGFGALEHIEPATIIMYPSEGNFAIVQFDDAPETTTVHKTRLGRVTR